MINSKKKVRHILISIITGLFLQYSYVVPILAKENSFDRASTTCFSGIITALESGTWSPFSSDYRQHLFVYGANGVSFPFGWSSSNPTDGEKESFNTKANMLQAAIISGHPVRIAAVAGSRCDPTAHSKDITVSICTNLNCS